MATRPNSEWKILIVDDDTNTLDVVHEAVKAENYQTQTATSADEALKKIQAFEPDLVLTDQDMPGFTGIEMLHELRKQNNYVTVIFLSGRGEPKLVAKALKEGAVDYIRKPFRFEELLARIDVALRLNDAHHELMAANKKLQDMVERDYLTGLFNMRSMYDRIDLELKRAKRFKRHLSCIMMDMDHFKKVNDQNDHLFGSFVLKETGRLINETMRDIDLAARYGGDEFLIVLTEANAEGTKIFCERLREKIENFEFKDGDNRIKLTISLGFTVTGGEDSNLDARQLVRQADHALYEAKAEGRNTIVCYQSGTR